MLFLHKLLAKLGIQTETYKIELFKAEHSRYVVMSTVVHNTVGDITYSDVSYRIPKIIGEGVLFAKKRKEAYLAVGRAEMDLYFNEYTVRHSSSGYGPTYVLDASSMYRVAFNVVSGATYRIRFNGDKRELEIVYERGDEHEIYTY